MRNSMDAQEVAVGWWPGDGRYGKPAFYSYAHPAREGFRQAALTPPAARWDDGLGEFILDWDDLGREADPHGAALDFARSSFRHASTMCAPAAASHISRRAMIPIMRIVKRIGARAKRI